MRGGLRWEFPSIGAGKITLKADSRLREVHRPWGDRVSEGWEKVRRTPEQALAHYRPRSHPCACQLALNQVEIYFSIVQRKALTPNDFRSLAELEDHLLRFQEHYQSCARPFQWKFTRCDLKKLLTKLHGEDLRRVA